MLAAMHLDTPLISAAPALFTEHDQVWLKMDCWQNAGSFKQRGVGRLVQEAVHNGAKAIVCASGGNAGFAAVYAAQACGVPVTIVLPGNSSLSARQAIAARGAQTIVHGDTWDQAHAFATQLAPQQGAAYVHPFDHPALWAGHATIIDEVVSTGTPFDCVIASVGGGGLLAGIVQGLHNHGLQHIPVIAVETLGADSLHQSLLAGERITLPAITSIAATLGARQVAQHAFELAREHRVISLTVTDAQAVQACLRFADAHRVLVEPACGAALAALSVHAQRLKEFRAPLIEVCGGIGVTFGQLKQWEQQFEQASSRSPIKSPT